MAKLVVEFPGCGFKIKWLDSLTLEKDCEMTKAFEPSFWKVRNWFCTIHIVSVKQPFSWWQTVLKVWVILSTLVAIVWTPKLISISSSLQHDAKYLSQLFRQSELNLVKQINTRNVTWNFQIFDQPIYSEKNIYVTIALN